MRARPGQKPFMQKNVPKNAPDWIETVAIWAETSKREVHYALCNDRPTLRWFANQRAVEYHPALCGHPADPARARPRPAGGRDFASWRRPRCSCARRWPARGWKARSRRAAPRACTSSSRSRPAARRSRTPRARWPPAPRRSTRRSPPPPTSSRSARARSSSTPRARAARPSSPPTPRASGRARRSRSRSAGTSSSASPRRLHDPHRAGAARRPRPVGRVDAFTADAPADLVEEGRAIPIARVAAMHEGKRRKRATET